MKHRWIALIAAIGLMAPASTSIAGSPRLLEGEVGSAGVDKVRLDSGVGDIEVTALDDTDRITVSVELRPRRGGFFSSMKKAQREVDEAELRMDVSKGVLRLEIETDSDDRHFEERWQIELPAELDFDLDIGVGDVEIRGIAGDLTIDAGVGDVVAEAVSGDISIDVGVGDAVVRAAAADYGSVEGSGGVGDAKLVVRGERISSSGFVGKSAEWTGEGSRSIEISMGVGDAEVILD
jgi:hypothetical protein